MFRCRPISLVLVGLFVWVTGCTSYSQIEIGEVADHAKVRVTTSDGERKVILDPRVEADSITGKDSRAIPVEQVAKLEAVGTDVGDTVGLTLLLVAVAGTVTWAIWCSRTTCLGFVGAPSGTP